MATRQINEGQRHLLVQRLQQRLGNDLRGHTIGVWGLAFKPGTDDMREAPSLVVVNALLAMGAQVQAYDPVAMDNARRIWGDHPGLQLVNGPVQAASGASALLVLTEWREFRSPDFAELLACMRHPVVLDGRNLYEPELMARLGFDYQAIGRGHAAPPAWATELMPQARQALVA